MCITSKIKYNSLLVWGCCSLMLAYGITLKAMFLCGSQFNGCCATGSQPSKSEKNTSCNMDHLRGKWKWPLPQAHSLSFLIFSDDMLFSKTERTCGWWGYCFHNDKWSDLICPKDYHNESSFKIFHLWCFSQWGKIVCSQEILNQLQGSCSDPDLGSVQRFSACSSHVCMSSAFSLHIPKTCR